MPAYGMPIGENLVSPLLHELLHRMLKKNEQYPKSGKTQINIGNGSQH